MELRFITKEKYNYLVANIDNNIQLGNYSNIHSWIDENMVDEYSKSTNIQLKAPKLITESSTNKISDTDLENCKLLYTAMKDLPIDVATSPQFWSYLTHITYWDYMQKRHSIKDSTTKKTIKEKFFHASKFTRNGIARLWWIAHTTYDSGYSDPFYLTEVLLKRQDLIVHILERNYSHNSNLTKFILKALDEYASSHIYSSKDGLPPERHLRELCKEFNRIGATKIIDFLTYEDVRDIVFSSLDYYTKIGLKRD